MNSLMQVQAHPHAVAGSLKVGLRMTVAILILAASGFAQDLVTVHTHGKQNWPAAEADKIYLSACSAVQQEFSIHRPVRPRVTLVLGAEVNNIKFELQEIRLTHWDRNLFAQGVVMLAFQDLMPREERIAITKRAINWAQATVDVGELKR